MIQRKDSLCYTEIIRGKYDLNNLNYIMKLFSNITLIEKNNLLQYTFEELWNMMWVNSNGSIKKDYSFSRNKFNTLKKGYYLHTKTKSSIINVSLKYLVFNSTSIKEPEWEFPKGRRKLHETDIKCSLREFEEETSIDKKDIIIDDTKKRYEEVYIGKNKLRYKNIFYVALYAKSNLEKSFFNVNNKEQIKEIKDVKWFDEDGVIKKIDNKVEKLEIFKRLHSYLMKKNAITT
jgi:8-oxo-dGTP pyrophosphatase MutT (NUDIX family)|tara:strand:- start:491 stop:1189 length:699 start_codon:yes stop_codon:yes gene_type:complete